MAMQKLTLGNLSGGKIDAKINRALQRVSESYDDEEELNGAVREIKIAIKFKMDKSGRFLSTTSKVELKLPTREEAGVAWLEGGEIVTEEDCIESTQLDLERRAANSAKVTPIARNSGN